MTIPAIHLLYGVGRLRPTPVIRPTPYRHTLQSCITGWSRTTISRIPTCVSFASGIPPLAASARIPPLAAPHGALAAARPTCQTQTPSRKEVSEGASGTAGMAQGGVQAAAVQPDGPKRPRRAVRRRALCQRGRPRQRAPTHPLPRRTPRDLDGSLRLHQSVCVCACVFVWQPQAAIKGRGVPRGGARRRGSLEQKIEKQERANGG